MGDFRLQTATESNLIDYQVKSGFITEGSPLLRFGLLPEGGSWFLAGPVDLNLDKGGKLVEGEGTPTNTIGYTLRINGENPFASGVMTFPDPSIITVYPPYDEKNPDYVQPSFACIA